MQDEDKAPKGSPRGFTQETLNAWEQWREAAQVIIPVDDETQSPQQAKLWRDMFTHNFNPSFGVLETSKLKEANARINRSREAHPKIAGIQRNYTEEIIDTLSSKQDDPNKDKTGKIMAGVLEDFLPALTEIAKLGSMNNKPNGKYDRGSWMLVENEVDYVDAFWRHLLAGRDNIDPETGMPHSVAIAWNAIALVWFQLKRDGKL